jgi:hypothetical protein
MPDVQGFADSTPPDPTRVIDAFRRMLSRSSDSSHPVPGIISEETRLPAGSREPGTLGLLVLDDLPEPVSAGAHLASASGMPLS